MKKIQPTLEIDCGNSNKYCNDCDHLGVDTFIDCFVCHLYDKKLVEQEEQEVTLVLRCDQCLADEVKEEA